MNSDPCLYMTFRLGDELFAIPVSQVREVLELTTITSVPGAPQYMRGLVNVRGKAIPVVDLRRRFGLPEGVETVNSRIVVMELELEAEAVILGGLADSVQEFIRGVTRRGEAFLIILDLQALFASEEFALVAETAP
jgi:purine-binding chemotaxis protein CheW